MIKRITSILLCVMMLAGLFTCLSGVSADAATTNQKNIVARANYMYNKTWVCKQNVYGWRNQTLFYQGYTYRVPYGQPAYQGRYIGYASNNSTLDDSSINVYSQAAATAGSIFYTQRSHYNYWYSTWYATDCSAYVAWTWGYSRMTTYSIPFASTNLGYTTASTAQNLQIGDCLNSNSVGHVVLVTGVTKNSAGTVTQIEITEQTPPQLKRSYYTPSTLGYYYSAYTIQRYYGTVPAAPDGSTVEDESTQPTEKPDLTKEYYPACSASCITLYQGFAELGLPQTKEMQAKVAEANGMTDYAYTAEQNTELLNLLKAGKMKNPDYDPDATTASTTESTKATTKATEADEIVYYPACSTDCVTLYQGFADVGIAQTKEAQQEIAEANGMTDYAFTAEQNSQLLQLLKEGKLINPNGPNSSIATMASSSTEEEEDTQPQETTSPAETEPGEDDVDPYFPACSSSCITLYQGFAEVGIPQTKDAQMQVAKANGMSDYNYTAEQNAQLLALLKAGKLVNPDFKGELPISGIDLGTKFKAFIYHFSSWKNVTKMANGNAAIYQRKGDNSQLFTFEKLSNGSYKILTQDGLALTVEGNSSTAGANVKFAAYTGAKGQHWAIQGTDGEYKFQPLCSSLCRLEVNGDSRANSTNILSDAATAGNEQKFQILQYDGNITKTGYENGYAGGPKGDGKIYTHGIDVSVHNEYDQDYSVANFDFKAAKAAGNTYVIIRAGSTNLGKDYMFEKYYAAAKAAGLNVGCYFYTYADDAAGARKDCNKLLSYIKGKKFEYPIYLDYEQPGVCDTLNSDQSKSLCMTFMTMLSNEGYLTGIYTGKYIAMNMDMSVICGKYDFWIAYYTSGYEYYTMHNEFSTSYGNYQYTCQYKFSGNAYGVDGNVAYKDYPSIVKKYGFNGYEKGSWTADGKFQYADGSTGTGWLDTNGKNYYLDKNGKPMTDTWLESGGDWYHFNGSGIMDDTAPVIGDVDKSKKLDIADVSYIQKVLARHIDQSDELDEIADVNGNGRLDIRDATNIQLYLGKFINYFKKRLV